MFVTLCVCVCDLSVSLVLLERQNSAHYLCHMPFTVSECSHFTLLHCRDLIPKVPVQKHFEKSVLMHESTNSQRKVYVLSTRSSVLTVICTAAAKQQLNFCFITTVSGLFSTEVQTRNNKTVSVMN